GGGRALQDVAARGWADGLGGGIGALRRSVVVRVGHVATSSVADRARAVSGQGAAAARAAAPRVVLSSTLTTILESVDGTPGPPRLSAGRFRRRAGRNDSAPRQ